MNRGSSLAYMDHVRFVLVTLVLGLCWSASADPRPHRLKPSAPVDVRIDSKAVPGGYEVRLVAIPTRDVPALELDVAGKHIAFGATAAGQRRELVTKVLVRGGEGLDVVGGARAAGRNRAAVLRVGEALRQAPKRTTIYTLSDGRQISEVR